MGYETGHWNGDGCMDVPFWGAWDPAPTDEWFDDEPDERGNLDLHSGDVMTCHYSPFGDRLQTMRRAQGMSQRRLALLMGRPHRTVNAWETGDTEPNLLDLADLARKLGSTIEDLVDCESTGRPRHLSSRAHGPANRERVGRQIEHRRHMADLTLRDVHRLTGIRAERMAAIEAGSDATIDETAKLGPILGDLGRLVSVSRRRGAA